MDSIMLDLHKAQVGQVVTIDEGDLDRLSLLRVAEVKEQSDAEPVELILHRREGAERLHFVLGAFDVPDDAVNVQLYGERAMARRYIRDVSKNRIYLSPSSFTYVSANTRDWSWRKMAPIRIMQELSVRTASGFAWAAKKSGPYSAITFDAPFQDRVAGRALADFFGSFLSDGIYAGVIEQGQESKYFQAEPFCVLTVKGGMGLFTKYSWVKCIRMTIFHIILRRGFLRAYSSLRKLARLADSGCM
jgi:hypothetical protein